MTIARNHHLFINQPTYFHLISRCVRRAYLCGKDKYSGKRYDHRKRWLEKRLLELSEIFFVDLYGYAIMSNHYHLIVKTRPDEAYALSNKQVAKRWRQIFPSHKKPEKDLCCDIEKVNIYRKRLCDISWLMRCLNEGLARIANREDKCNGRFWQGRFKSQILLDESAVYACMVYVDLNPVRAGISKSPVLSKQTSLNYRIVHQKTEQYICPINHSNETMALSFSDYVNLVEDTHKCAQQNDSEEFSWHVYGVLVRLDLRQSGFVNMINSLSENFCRAIGRIEQLDELSATLNLKWVKGRRSAIQLFT